MVVAQHPDQPAADGKQKGAGGIHRRGAGHKNHAAQRRSGDDSRLHAGRTEGHCARQHDGRHQHRRQGLLSRHLKSPRHAQHDRHAEQQLARSPTRRGAPALRGGHQNQRHAGLRHQAGRHDAAPVQAVGHMARHQRQKQRRRKLVQADQPQIPGAAGQVIHLPADCDHQHLVASGSKKAGKPHAHESALVGEFCKAVDRHGP